MHFKSQEATTTSLINKLKEEQQAAEDKSKMGLGQIWDIVLAWRDRTKRLVEESSVQWWSRWAKQGGGATVAKGGCGEPAEKRRRILYIG